MRIKIKTPSRLHFTLIDENGSIGRVDGGIGLALNTPNFTLEIANQVKINTSTLNAEESGISSNLQRVIETAMGKIHLVLKLTDCGNPDALLDIISDVCAAFIQKIQQQFPSLNPNPFPLEMVITDFLSSHLGYGSKTQLSLAIAKGLAMFLDIDSQLDIVDLTNLVSRGGTSGIGFRAFEDGGFILDSGHRFGSGEEKTTFLPSSASNARPARTIVRYDFPEDWWVMAVTLNVKAGASNLEEVNIFQEYCPIDIDEVRQVSHIILMQILPSIIEHNLLLLGDGIEKIQGLGFKKIEVRLQHEDVKSLIKFQREHGAPCVGMSSFGPTVYSIFHTEAEAEKMLDLIKTEYAKTGFVYYLTKANNRGAEIEILED